MCFYFILSNIALNQKEGWPAPVRSGQISSQSENSCRGGDPLTQGWTIDFFFLLSAWFAGTWLVVSWHRKLWVCVSQGFHINLSTSVMLVCQKCIKWICRVQPTRSVRKYQFHDIYHNISFHNIVLFLGFYSDDEMVVVLIFLFFCPFIWSYYFLSYLYILHWGTTIWKENLLSYIFLLVIIKL